MKKQKPKLDREVCRRCYHPRMRTLLKKRYVKRLVDALVDKDFDLGVLACLVVDRTRQISWRPPDVCPYKLEHAVAAGMTNVK